MRALSRKPVVVLIAVAAGILLLAAGRAEWISGTVEGVTGQVPASATGAESAPGLAGLALVAMAAAVAATTSGRVARWICILALIGVGGGVIGLAARALLNPPEILGAVAAETSGGTGTLEASATANGWPWAAIAAGGILLLAALGAMIGTRTWGALGGRYERPAGANASDSSGERGERVDSAWDRVTRGDDPSVD